LAPPHDASGHTWHHPDDMLFEITKWGTDAVVPGPNKSNMPGFSETLGDEDVWAVLAYIKSRWPQELRDAQPPSRVGETAGSSP
jgi:mono/diheme cytochrome c family protein